MKVLLDTNAYAALMEDHRQVAALVRRAGIIRFSSIVVGELLYGFQNGSRYQANRAQLDRFLDHVCVDFVPVSMETCERFGLLAAALRRKGAVIPTNDVWIAAHCFETASTLITSDCHFLNVEGLPVELIGPAA